MSQWIKKGDKVVVLAGNDKGRTGTVLRKTGDRVVVQGINIRKKHVKRQKQAQMPSVIEVEMSLHLSSIALCDEHDKPVKVRVRSSTKGAKELYYVSGDKETLFRTIRK